MCPFGVLRGITGHVACSVYGHFSATACASPQEKLAFLAQHCVGKASNLITPLIHSGASYSDVYARLHSRFGQPHVVVSAHIERLSQIPPVRMHNSEQLLDFAMTLSGFVTVLQSQGYSADLKSPTNLSLVVQKLLADLKESWSKHVVRSHFSRPTLLHFNAWITTQADAHEFMRSSILTFQNPNLLKIPK